jgi:hypothetical protein
MPDDLPIDDATGPHPFLIAALDLERAFEGFRRDLLVPFDEPETSDAYWTVWHDRESQSRAQCEAAVLHWIEHRTRPALDDDAVAYFLCHRFDTAAEFLQNVVLEDGTSLFRHTEDSFGDFLFAMLIDWWESHGIREAYFQDLAEYERKHYPSA